MPDASATHMDWAAVDAAVDPSFFVRFLDTSRAPLVALARANPVAFFAYLDVHSGQRVVDAACGLGDFTRLLGLLVALDGEAVGIDFSQTMVDEARRRAGENGVPVSFEQGDIMSLDFAANSFDRARAEQVLQHISSPERALAELTRVTKPGGLLAIMEPDWDTLIIDADDVTMSRAGYDGCHAALHLDLGLNSQWTVAGRSTSLRYPMISVAATASTTRPMTTLFLGFA